MSAHMLLLLPRLCPPFVEWSLFTCSYAGADTHRIASGRAFITKIKWALLQCQARLCALKPPHITPPHPTPPHPTPPVLVATRLRQSSCVQEQMVRLGRREWGGPLPALRSAKQGSRVLLPSALTKWQLVGRGTRLKCSSLICSSWQLPGLPCLLPTTGLPFAGLEFAYC